MTKKVNIEITPEEEKHLLRLTKDKLIEDLISKGIPYKKSWTIKKLLSLYGIEPVKKKAKFQSIKRKVDELGKFNNFNVTQYQVDKNTFQVTITIDGHEIPKYHRNRSQHNSKIMYDPLSTYKSRFKKILIKSILDLDLKKHMDEAVYMELEVVSKPPRSRSKKEMLYLILGEKERTTVPDVDNFDKTAYDLMNSIMYTDDAQIYKSSVIKKYGVTDRTTIKLYYKKDTFIKGSLTSKELSFLKKKYSSDKVDDILKNIEKIKKVLDS